MPSFRAFLQLLDTRPDPGATLNALRHLCSDAARSGQLRALHEALLFYRAYPPSREIRELCDRELARFKRRIAALAEDERAELDQTAIAGTRIFYSYDEPMARWLQRQTGGRIDVDWDEYDNRDDNPLFDHLPRLMENCEADAVDDPDYSVRDLITAARGARHKTDLAWILDRFRAAYPASVREHLYNTMGLPLCVDMSGRAPSRTRWDDGPPSELFLWDPAAARAKFDLVTEVKKPLRIPPPVDEKRGRQLLNLVYGTLLPRLRELYPATYGNPAEIYDIPLARGIRILLWFMQPAFRLPLEAGWGLLVLKNNVPIGYGAGGMLGDRSEIAINVFDTFRGGEAAWLYSQYARIFYAISGAPWLVTRRYQLGHENEEGLASGAYWFWDKLGFRSVEPDIRKLADTERKRIAARKGYRSPRRILKELAAADVVLSLTGESAAAYREFPLGQAGMLATRTIATQFAGNRSGLESRVLKDMRRQFGVESQGLTSAERSRIAHMGLFAMAIPDFPRWSPKDRQKVWELGRLKGSAHEADYARALLKNSRFFAALAAAGSQGA